MNEQFKAYDSKNKYSGKDHAPTSHPGHGNIVKHKADGDRGVVVASNSERSLVLFGKNQNWYPNTDLKIHVDHIVK